MIKKLTARLLAAMVLLLHLTMTALAADTESSGVGAAALEGNWISAIHEGPSGDLWLGTGAGLSRWIGRAACREKM